MLASLAAARCARSHRQPVALRFACALLAVVAAWVVVAGFCCRAAAIRRRPVRLWWSWLAGVAGTLPPRDPPRGAPVAVPLRRRTPRGVRGMRIACATSLRSGRARARRGRRRLGSAPPRLRCRRRAPLVAAVAAGPCPPRAPSSPARALISWPVAPARGVPRPAGRGGGCAPCGVPCGARCARKEAPSSQHVARAKRKSRPTAARVPLAAASGKRPLDRPRVEHAAPRSRADVYKAACSHQRPSPQPNEQNGVFILFNSQNRTKQPFLLTRLLSILSPLTVDFDLGLEKSRRNRYNGFG